MKKLVIFSLLLVGLSSCEIYYLEPRHDARRALVGSYTMDEYSETYNDQLQYTIWIALSSYNSNEIVIDNFYNADVSIRASVAGDKITIWRQVVDGYEIEGVGTVYGSQLSFQYHVRDLVTGSRTDFCESTAWRY